MSQNIVNAAPMVIALGTQDLSTRQVPREPLAIPQHLPKFYLFAQKGRPTPQLVVGAERDTLFGSLTFDERSKYANHATIFANQVNACGNICMLQRVIPEDAGPESNLTLWLDVLPTTVDLYERNIDGSFVLNNGAPVVKGTAAGYKAKWVVTRSSDAAGAAKFGQQTIGQGNQVDQAANVQSQRFPILELKASAAGDYGNNCGVRIWAPTQVTDPGMPKTMMAKKRAYPFNISMIRRDDAMTTPKVVESVFGEQYITTVLKEGVIDPSTDKQLFIGDILLDSYQNITDPRYTPVYGDFGTMAFYSDNVAALVEMFHTAEIPYIDEFSDFTASADDHYLFNFISGVSSQNVPYQTFRFVDDTDSIRLSELTNIMAGGGSDGTMNDAVFAQLVEAEMARYADPNDELMELAVNVESIMYDSGFPLSTKYALCQFISQRKDTSVVLSTHTVGEPNLSPSEEYSLAIALRTRLQNYPESDYFGTPVMRGMIVGRSAKLRLSNYTKRLPLSLEVAIKAAKYMGAGNGRWKGSEKMSGAPGSIVDSMTDISITWVPASVRNRNWDAGLVWVQAYDSRSFFFPAFKTVYNDDTSVLNSFLTVAAIAEINKVANAAWREFSGVDYLTGAQLVERVNAFMNARLQGRFDDHCTIVPDAQFTDADLLRGFSWTLPVIVYAKNMLTVMTTYVQARRASDLPST